MDNRAVSLNWCSCEQRPVEPGLSVCYVCSKMLEDYRKAYADKIKKERALRRRANFIVYTCLSIIFLGGVATGIFATFLIALLA